MAFVCESKRIFHDYNNSTKNVGPGQYESPDTKKLNQTVAAQVPFNSSNIKRSIYDQSKILDNVASKKTGPGYYDIDYSFAKGNIKTYTKNSSVMFKIDSLQSQEFKSKVPRFKSLETDIPGPGEYSHDIRFSTVNFENKKQSLEKRKKLKDKISGFLKDLRKHNHISSKPSIPSRTLKLTKKSQNQSDSKASINRQEKTENFKQQYDPSFSQEKVRKTRGFTWAKSERKMSVDSHLNSTLKQIGPGKYFKDNVFGQNQNFQSIVSGNSNSIRKKRAKTQTSVFASKYPRTFFDQMMYETYSKDITRTKEKIQLKTTKLGPGYYEIQSPLSKKLKKSNNLIAYQFFGSTVERFPTELKQSGQIHDLLYPNGIKQKPVVDIQFYNSIGKSKSYNIKKNAFLSTMNSKKTIFDKEDTIPGPGEYEIQNLKQVFKPKKGKSVQNFGMSKERFPPENSSSEFKQSESIGENDNDLRRKKEQQSFMFKSKQKKQPLYLRPSEDENFGKYDLTSTDLGNKLKKQAMFLQNLKKIDVSIPGFNSANPRFEYEKKKKVGSLSKESKNESDKEKKGLFLNTRTDKMREAAIQKNKEQVVKSKKSTIYNNDEKKDRFRDVTLEQKLKTPGVGQYSLRSNWTKQTYNLKYHKSYVMAQVSRSNYQGFPFDSIEEMTESER